MPEYYTARKGALENASVPDLRQTALSFVAAEELVTRTNSE